MNPDLLDDFLKFCESRGVDLLPHQIQFAQAALSSDAMRQFMIGGMSSGRTLTMTLLESFFDLQRQTDARKPN